MDNRQEIVIDDSKDGHETDCKRQDRDARKILVKFVLLHLEPAKRNKEPRYRAGFSDEVVIKSPSPVISL